MEEKLEAAFRNYLAKADLDYNQIGEIQRTEMRRAFMAGVGEGLRAFQNDILLEPAIELSLGMIFGYIEKYVTTVVSFFLKETKKQEERNQSRKN